MLWEGDLAAKKVSASSIGEGKKEFCSATINLSGQTTIILTG
jgi:hypothetical protein